MKHHLPTAGIGLGARSLLFIATEEHESDEDRAREYSGESAPFLRTNQRFVLTILH
jgi:hypothetical protein